MTRIATALLALLCTTLSLDGAQAGERVWVNEKICNIEDASQCVEWSTTEDVQIAPPGWVGSDGEACVWQDDLDAGKCEPMEGWKLVFDPALQEHILVLRGPPLVTSQSIDTARAWNSLSGWRQINIRLGRATIYDFIVFTRDKQCKPEDALNCADTWTRRDAQTETIASPQPAPAAPVPQTSVPTPPAKQTRPPRLRFAPHATPGSVWPPQW
jgi:hypothetical protein